MRKLLLALLICVPFLGAAEYPNLYGVAGVLSDGELVAGVSSDIIGKWGVALNVGRLTTGATLLGLTGDIGYFAEKCHIDYFWKERTAKVLVNCARDFKITNWRDGWKIAFLFTIVEI